MKVTLGKNISCKGAVAIGWNKAWNHLELLSFSEYQIRDQGAMAIADNITWLKLKSLSLHTNKIGEEGAMSLSKIWTELEELKLYNNPFNGENLLLHQAFSGEAWKSLKTFIPFVNPALRDFFDSIKNQKNVTEVYLCSKVLTDEDAIIWPDSYGL